jgi:hypothetical protein
MAQAVGQYGIDLAVEAEIFLVENGLEKLALPLRKNEIGGLRHAPLFPRTEVSDVFLGGVCTLSTRAG